MKDITKLFGSKVFNDSVMRERLTEGVYCALKKTMTTGTELELGIADAVAKAMMEWAVEKGATHYTHWFQPMTGVTAEKHDSFIEPSKNGGAILEFSGKALIKGESDASSFPSGGLRCTFEARGYTVWDTTSYAFIKDGTLCIPTAFCSYSGEALDKKTPLLRSMEALNKQALRILRLFGNKTVEKVTTTVGPEQEYFLIDREMYRKRPDLVYTGRTLFGAKPPKEQEMADYYFASLKPRVSVFMKDLDEELWALGVYAKTKHNEAAPAQHEFAPIYGTTNIATDHNQLIMETLKTVASKHDLACLLHEKPFAGVSGSGKHNNWSLSTDSGDNLLEPGKTPYQNAQFLLFLTAVIKAVNEYQDLLRASAASAGNDHRLGANEAPPAIISMFLGDELVEILEAIDTGAEYKSKGKASVRVGVSVLPNFSKDSTDRNRTSPFAFTGNRFEFRMLGSAFNIAGPNIILNTAVAEVLEQFADQLENVKDFKNALAELIKNTYHDNKRIVFNGNNYANEWITEAKKRGLSNLTATADALPVFINKKSINLFSKQGVFSSAEAHSNFQILMDNYCKTLNIEALTMIEITKRMIIPSLIEYQNQLAKLLERKKKCGITVDDTMEGRILTQVSKLSGSLMAKLDALEKVTVDAKENVDIIKRVKFYRSGVLKKMCELRVVADELETLVGKKYWPLPSYGDILMSVV